MLTRLTSFLFVVVFGGLAQLWTLVVMLWVNDERIEIGRVLGDGGLFFFAVSLTITSGVALQDQFPIKFGNRDWLVSFVLGGFVLFVAIVTYSHYLAQHPGNLAPFREKVDQQLACTALALAYWLYVGVRTGQFKASAA